MYENDIFEANFVSFMTVTSFDKEVAGEIYMEFIGLFPNS